MSDPRKGEGNQSFQKSYISPHSIMEHVKGVAFRLQLPDELFRVYNVFHVSQPCKYIPNTTHMIESEPLQL